MMFKEMVGSIARNRLENNGIMVPEGMSAALLNMGRKPVTVEAAEAGLSKFTEYLGDRAEKFYQDMVVADTAKCVLHEPGFYQHGDLMLNLYMCVARCGEADYQQIEGEFSNSSAIAKDYAAKIKESENAQKAGGDLFVLAATKICKDAEMGMLNGIVTHTEGIQNVDFKSAGEAFDAFTEYLGDGAEEFYSKIMSAHESLEAGSAEEYEFKNSVVQFWEDMERGAEDEFEMIKNDMSQLVAREGKGKTEEEQETLLANIENEFNKVVDCWKEGKGYNSFRINEDMIDEMREDIDVLKDNGSVRCPTWCAEMALFVEAGVKAEGVSHSCVTFVFEREKENSDIALKNIVAWEQKEIIDSVNSELKKEITSLAKERIAANLMEGKTVENEGEILHVDFDNAEFALDGFLDYLGDDSGHFFKKLREADEIMCRVDKDYQHGDLAADFWHDMERGYKLEFPEVESKFKSIFKDCELLDAKENAADAVSEVEIAEDEEKVVRLNNDVDLVIGKNAQGYILDIVKAGAEVNDVTLLNSVTVWEDDYQIDQEDEKAIEDETFKNNRKTFFNIFSTSAVKNIVGEDIESCIENQGMEGLSEQLGSVDYYDKNAIINKAIETKFEDIVNPIFDDIRDFVVPEVRKVFEAEDTAPVVDAEEENDKYLTYNRQVYTAIFRTGALEKIVDEEIEQALNNDFDGNMVDSPEAEKIDTAAICDGIIKEYGPDIFNPLYDVLYECTQDVVEQTVVREEKKQRESRGEGR